MFHQADGHLHFEGKYLYAAHEEYRTITLYGFDNNKMKFSTLPK